MCSVVGGKLRWRDATTAAVRTYLVEVTPPIGDDLASLDQRREPVFVETFVAELAVEALDVAVLHGFAGFDQDETDLVGGMSVAAECQRVGPGNG